MKPKIEWRYSDQLLEGWYECNGEQVHACDLIGMYNELIDNYNAIYHELAEYIPYAAPAAVAKVNLKNHLRCSAFIDADCHKEPCSDCDLNEVPVASEE